MTMYHLSAVRLGHQFQSLQYPKQISDDGTDPPVVRNYRKTNDLFVLGKLGPTTDVKNTISQNKAAP